MAKVIVVAIIVLLALMNYILIVSCAKFERDLERIRAKKGNENERTD